MQVFFMKWLWVVNFGLERIVRSLGCWGDKVPMLGVEVKFGEITTNMQIDVNKW
jgi:hypothetical protein